jgi:plastocyanin
VDRGAFLFSQNCRTCHGDSGEGGQKANRLALAPALDRPDLQGKNAQTGEVDSVAKTNVYKLVYYTISCGRVGKAMPTWSQAQGGPLNDEQIKQLAIMITEGTGWDTAKEYAIEGVPEAHIAGDETDGIRLVEPLSMTGNTVYLNTVDPLGKGSRLQIDDELLLITDAPNKDAKTATVERGVGTTNPASHDKSATVLKPPVPPDPPAVTGATGPVCGQYPPAVQPTPSGPAVAATELKLIAKNIQFDSAALTGAAGKELTVTLDNQDSGVPHNVHFFKGTDNTGDSVGATEIATGPIVQTLKLGPLDAGSYYYQCDVHPTMLGTLTVQ